MTDPLSFGRLLKRYRRARDLTQQELARRISCALTTIKKLEADERRPSRELAERFAQVLEVPPSDLSAFLQLARGITPGAVPQPLPLAPAPTSQEVGAEHLSGREVRGYSLGEPLGIGGLGAVYRATQSSIQREVAIKIILPRYANHPDFIRRFEAEARFVARLEHPHIVPLYDYWREPNSAYLVMRYMRGGSLAAAVRAGPLPVDAVLRVLEQVGAALAVAHRAGVVHRDIKPANILRDAEGYAYLADFGIAKDLGSGDSVDATQAGAIIGSPDYLAPEQITDEPVASQTDIYSLGVMLYELLAGERPFQRVTPADLLRMHLSTPLPLLRDRRPDLPATLDAIIQRATAKRPTERYADVLNLVADFRTAVGLQEQALDSRHAEFRGHQIASGERATILLDLLDLENPYKGLRAFGEADVADFFGRETLVARLLERMVAVDPDPPLPAAREGAMIFGSPAARGKPAVSAVEEDAGAAVRFLAVVGPSGSGKSSVVRAGLVPALRQGGVPGSEHWFITEVLPGAHPLEELELALLRVAARQPANLMDQLQRDERGLLRAARLVLPDDSASELLLVIDQFEEVFTLIDDEAARTHFLNILIAAVTDARSRVRVVVTLRADFYDRPLRYSGLGELMQARTEVVLPLTPDELEQAIVGPAKRVGVAVEPELIADIVHDVGEQPGTLPLIQYALTELFERREGRKLVRTAYRAGGGVRGALARRAEAIYAALDPASQVAARQIFLRLVTLGTGAEDTRRRVRQSELESIVNGSWSFAAGGSQPTTRNRPWPAVRQAVPELDEGHEPPGPRQPATDKVIDLYGQARLLTFDRDPLTREPTIEVAHEALLREWERLREWLETSRSDVRTQRLLAAAALEWSQHGHDPGFLSGGARLAQFAALAESSNLALNADERLYLDASLEERDRLAAAEQARQAQELAQAQALAAEQAQRAEEQSRAAAASQQAAAAQRRAAQRLRILVVGLMLFLVAAIGLSVFALTQRSRAETNLRRSEAQRLAAEANALYQASGDAEIVALLAVRSLGMEYTPQGDAALASAATLEYPRQIFSDHSDWVQDAAFSPDGRYLLTGGTDKTARLWQVRTGQTIQIFKGHTGAVNGVAFSPDGRSALTASQDKTARLWDVQSGKEIRTFNGHTDQIWGVAFSPDGKQVLTGSYDDTARLWDTQTGQEIRAFKGHTGDVYGVAFAPNGQYLLTSSQDQTLRLWDAQTGQEIRAFKGHAEQIRSVAFSPDGKYIVSGSHDKTARLWDAQTGTELRRFIGHKEFIWKVAFSPDGKYVLTGSQDKTARLWDVPTGAELQRYSGHTNYVLGVAFSPDGASLVTASRDKTARLWTVQSSTLLPSFTGHTSDIHWVIFSPDGRYVLAGSLDKTARLWDAHTGQFIQVFRGHTNAIHTVAYAPDGKYIFTCSFDKTARLWDVQTGQEVRAFAGHTGIVYGVAVSADGRLVATSSDDADPTIRLWDAQTAAELRVLRGHTGGIHSLAFSPDNKYVLSGSFDKTARLWDAQTGQEVRKFDIPDSAVSLAFSPDGRSFLTGSNDKTARLWDAQTGQEVRQFVGHTDTVKSAVFSPDGRYILTGSADGTARLWDAQTGQEIRRLSGHAALVNSVAFSPDGHYILTGSGDRTARLWDVDYHDTVRALCGRLLRDFSAAERAQYGITDDGPTCGQS
jgi:WD40 repeat protein/transcriptional regulator with XRE-family HTH domain